MGLILNYSIFTLCELMYRETLKLLMHLKITYKLVLEGLMVVSFKFSKEIVNRYICG